MQRIDRYRDEWPIAVAGLACAVGYFGVSRAGDLDGHRPRLALVVSAVWVLFALAGFVVRSSKSTKVIDSGRYRRRLTVVVLAAACCQLPGVLVAPQSSSDAYRYVWDGRVQLSGTSPYRYVPLDDRLARLRDPLLFPRLRPTEPSGVRTLDRLPTEPAAVRALAHNDARTRINRPRVPTIYPPVAQAWFTGVALVTPWSWGTRGLQIAAALLAIGLTLGLGRWLLRRGRDPAAALAWGWCPVVVLETGNGAHIDVLAAVFVVAAIAVLGERKNVQNQRLSRIVGGLLIGLAAATKIIPLLLLPALTALRRRNGGGRQEYTVPVTALGAFVLSYLPHVLAVGALVLGYLPGYLSEEGFDDGGGRYAVIGLVLPGPARQPVAFALALILAGCALWRTEVERPERTAVWLFGGALLIATPAYAWYCLPLVALAVLAGRPEWLTVAVGGYLAYAGTRVPYLPGVAYAGAALLVALVTVGRLDRRPLRAGAARFGPDRRLRVGESG